MVSNAAVATQPFDETHVLYDAPKDGDCLFWALHNVAADGAATVWTYLSRPRSNSTRWRSSSGRARSSPRACRPRRSSRRSSSSATGRAGQAWAHVWAAAETAHVREGRCAQAARAHECVRSRLVPSYYGQAPGDAGGQNIAEDQHAGDSTGRLRKGTQNADEGAGRQQVTQARKSCRGHRTRGHASRSLPAGGGGERPRGRVGPRTERGPGSGAGGAAAQRERVPAAPGRKVRNGLASPPRGNSSSRTTRTRSS